MSDAHLIHSLLPARVPQQHAVHLALYVFRRMGAHGIEDAHAANALLGTFGLAYRRPLLVMRAMVLDLSKWSRRKIRLAGCCCRRMTADEALLVEALLLADQDPDHSEALLAALLGSPHAMATLATVQAVSAAFCDAGHFLGPRPNWSRL